MDQYIPTEKKYIDNFYFHIFNYVILLHQKYQIFLFIKNFAIPIQITFYHQIRYFFRILNHLYLSSFYIHILINEFNEFQNFKLCFI